MKACVLTWGCQLNALRSQEIEGVLGQAGFTVVDRPEQADVVVLNTCMVRQRAEDKVAGRVGELSRLKQEKPFLIAVGGCMPQGRGSEILRLLPQADFAFGTTDVDKLPHLIERARAGEKFAYLPAPNGLERLPIRRPSSFQAYVRLAEGCSHACSYCVVPRVRGPLRSRPLPEIVGELRGLAEQGYKEVTLLGQNVDAYGLDLGDGTRFAEVLRAASPIPIPWIRFTTSHPAYMEDAVMDALAHGANLCPHVHLAVQSGSDRVLQAMNRGYTAEEFLALVGRLRRKVPEVNITTDVIVGFPGETERDFAATVELVKEAQFGTVYVAAYSPRPGTAAAALPDDVPLQEKQRRLEALLALTRQLALDLHRRRIGTTVTVLAHQHLPEKNLVMGKTKDFRTVLVPGERALVGQFLEVDVLAASSGALHGRVRRGWQ